MASDNTSDSGWGLVTNRPLLPLTPEDEEGAVAVVIGATDEDDDVPLALALSPLPLLTSFLPFLPPPPRSPSSSWRRSSRSAASAIASSAPRDTPNDGGDVAEEIIKYGRLKGRRVNVIVGFCNVNQPPIINIVVVLVVLALFHGSMVTYL